MFKTVQLKFSTMVNLMEYQYAETEYQPTVVHAFQWIELLIDKHSLFLCVIRINIHKFTSKEFNVKYRPWLYVLCMVFNFLFLLSELFFCKSR